MWIDNESIKLCLSHRREKIEHSMNSMVTQLNTLDDSSLVTRLFTAILIGKATLQIPPQMIGTFKLREESKG